MNAEFIINENWLLKEEAPLTIAMWYISNFAEQSVPISEILEKAENNQSVHNWFNGLLTKD